MSTHACWILERALSKPLLSETCGKRYVTAKKKNHTCKYNGLTVNVAVGFVNQSSLLPCIAIASLHAIGLGIELYFEIYIGCRDIMSCARATSLHCNAATSCLLPPAAPSPSTRQRPNSTPPTRTDPLRPFCVGCPGSTVRRLAQHIIHHACIPSLHFTHPNPPYTRPS